MRNYPTEKPNILPDLVSLPLLCATFCLGKTAVNSAIAAGDLPEPVTLAGRKCWRIADLVSPLRKYGLAYMLPDRLKTPTTAQGDLPELSHAEETRALERMDKLLETN